LFERAAEVLRSQNPKCNGPNLKFGAPLQTGAVQMRGLRIENARLAQKKPEPKELPKPRQRPAPRSKPTPKKPS
jgi:hypothetical protein